MKKVLRAWVLRYASLLCNPLCARSHSHHQEYSHICCCTNKQLSPHVCHAYICINISGRGCGKTYVFISDVIDEGGVCVINKKRTLRAPIIPFQPSLIKMGVIDSAFRTEIPKMIRTCAGGGRKCFWPNK